MDTNTTAARPTPVLSKPLDALSNTELLASTRRLVGRSNQVLAELLAHLGEVEARGIHRTCACPSLYVYCIYELRLSEDEAYRRVTAARLLRRFPLLFDALASGELHLTGLLMLGPHLTTENLVEVLARAKHRTKREVARLVRFLDPLPAVPARIEPLGPAPVGAAPSAPSWAELTESLCPVRELTPGERPGDWVGVTVDCATEQADEADRAELHETARDRVELASADRAGAKLGGAAGAGATVDAADRTGAELDETTRAGAELDETTRTGAELDETARAGAEVEERQPSALARELAQPERFKVQFTATDEYVRLVEEATALLSHTVPKPRLDDIQLRAMRVFVTVLRKRRYGSGATSANPASANPTSANPTSANPTSANPAAESAERASGQDESAAEPASGSVAAPAREPTAEPAPTRRRGRYIPAGVRSAVLARDGARCSHIDASGRRCPETYHLEFHHVKPFARGGAHELSNITLRCSAHNALAAEDDFGAARIRASKDWMRHDSLKSQRIPPRPDDC